MKSKKLLPSTKKSYFDQVTIYSNTESAKAASKTVRMVADEVTRLNKKALEDSEYAESRARARLKAVKKTNQKTIQYTSRAIVYTTKAKDAANASLKAAIKARTTNDPKIAHKNATMAKKYAQDALKASNLSKKNAKLAIKSSIRARAAARIPLAKRDD